MYALEWLLVNFQSDEKRRALVPFLKARLAVLSGTGGQHLPAFDLAKSDSASVLAYVESLLREINRLLAVTACRERLRKRRQLRLVWFIGITVLLLLIVLAVVYHLDCRGVLWTMPVPLMGALGGFISSQRHVQSIASVGESLTDMTNLYFFGSNLTASAISGAVFAAVLFMLFAGGLVQGGLFPKWPVPENGDFWQEFAKLLTWSFIAGFAERFVPDTLDHLVARSSKQ